jgi:hypothetical protein
MESGDEKVVFSAAYFVISCACLKMGEKQGKRVDAIFERKLR